MDKISIIVPVFNTEKYLQKCVESILTQTYSNIELILVDDGSTDESGFMCDQFTAIDSRVIVLHKGNGGQATARNIALDIATGGYIGFVDSDDYIFPDMYTTMINSMKKNSADIAVCARYNVYEDGRKTEVFSLGDQLVMDSKEAIKRLFTYRSIDSSPCDKLFRRELFDDIRFPVGYVCEDVDVVYQLFCRANRIIHCGQPFYCYLQRQGSTAHASFNEKTKGLEIYHKKASEDIKLLYPDLIMEADYFYLSRLPVLYNKMLQCSYSGDYKEHIRQVIVLGMKKVWKNPYFSKMDRLMMVLIKYRLYDVIWKLLRGRKWREKRG